MGYAPAIWSVTSYIELAREAEVCEREARLHPLEETGIPYIKSLFEGVKGPIVAVSDYQKSLPASIARWMPSSYTVLGTDGFGLSESREALRQHFEVDAAHIVRAVLAGLYQNGDISEETLKNSVPC